ncbi:hypothetical protein B0H13DRAFT_1085909 [Mycena leptocephala]|nr:hypothetical protein B0H13DRAFT_1085909 [Mycena leptocephala]
MRVIRSSSLRRAGSPPTAKPVLYTHEYSLSSFAPPFNPILTCPADNDTYFPRKTRRARLGGIGPEVVEVGSGSDKSQEHPPLEPRTGILLMCISFSRRAHWMSSVPSLSTLTELDGERRQVPIKRPSHLSLLWKVDISYYSCTVGLPGDG